MSGLSFLRSWLLPFVAMLAAFSAPVQAQGGAPTIARVDHALDAAKEAMLSDPSQASSMALAAERTAEQLPAGRERTLAVARALWLQGEAQLRMDAPQEARAPILNALKLIEPIREPLKLRGDLLLSRGGLQNQENQAAAALASYQQAHKVYQDLGETRSQSIALQNIASLYAAANDNVRAERYYRQAAEVYGGDERMTLSLRNNLGNVLIQLERYKEAQAQFEQARAIARRMKSAYLEVRILDNLARAYVEDYDLAGAERALAEGFRLTRDAEASDFRPQLLGTAARVALTRGDLPRARTLIGESFAGQDLAKTGAAFRDRHFFAYRIYSKSGDTKLALAHLEALKRLNDESNKVATSASAALMAARFDYANQELRIANLKAEELRRNVAFERSRARFQRILFFSIVGASLILVALLSFGVVTLRRSRNQVRDANTVLNQTNTALEKALAAKTEFLATTSHEIRTPLNGILGMTQVMLSDQKLDAATRDRIGIVHGAGVTMRALVDDILDVAKMETGNMTVERAPMDLCATMGEVTRMWQEQARDKGLAFTLDCSEAPEWIESDAARLRQIIFNLLSNAIKFTAKGAVSVSAKAADTAEGKRLNIAISDSGIGIPAEKHEEIFESFKQADGGTTRQFGGTGLGLTICRNLARALGGDIHVDSVVGAGATFIVDLPLVLAEAPKRESGAERQGALLILDRNPITRSMLKTLLEPRAGSLIFAADPDEAREHLATGAVTRLLIDEGTLKSAGEPLEVLPTLAQAATNAGIHAVLLWVNPEEPFREQVTKLGLTLVAKPVAGTALIQALFETNLDLEQQRKSELVSHAA